MNLTEFSIQRPYYISIFWVIILLAGYHCFFSLPVSFFARNAYVQLSVTTVYPGVRREEVLEQVTKKLEHELEHLHGIRNITSITRDEISEIFIDCERQIKEAEAVSLIYLAVSQTKDILPQDVKQPVIETLGSFRSPLFKIAVNSSLPLEDLTSLSQRFIQPFLKEVEGISHINVFGEKKKQIVIRLDLEKMKEREVSASEVFSRINNAGKDVCFTDGTAYLFKGDFKSIEEIGAYTIHFLSNDRLVSLKDIAEIKEEFVEPTNYAYHNGKPCLILEVYDRKLANDYLIEKQITKLLKRMQKDLRAEGNFSFDLIYNREPNILNLMNDFKRNTWLAIGAAFLIIAFVFKDWSSIIVSMTSIPLSLCGAFVLLYFWGVSLNIYSVLALIISIGLIIDDIIVIRENIFRHLELGLRPFAATRKGIQEMMVPVIGTTAMILCVAVSMILVQKTPNTEYLGVFGKALLAAVGFSLLEALTLGPMLCAYCLKRKSGEKKKSIFDQISQKVLCFIQKGPKQIVFYSLLILGVGIGCMHFLRTEGLPLIETGNIQIVKRFEENNLSLLNEDAIAFSQQLRENYPDIETLSTEVEKREQKFYIQLLPKKQRIDTPAKIRKELDGQLENARLKGKLESFKVYDNVVAIYFFDPDYCLMLSSDDPVSLYEYKQKMLQLLYRSQSLINLIDTSELKHQEKYAFLKSQEMDRLGIEFTPLVREFEILMKGADLDANYSPSDHSPLLEKRVRIEKSISPKKFLTGVNAANINGKLIPTSLFSHFSAQKSVQKEIRRMNGKDSLEITGTINPSYRGENPTYLTLEAMKQTPPDGIQVDWGGESRKLLDMLALEKNLLTLVLFLVYIVLVLFYQSMTLPLVVFAPLPFAFMGSVIALVLSGNTINAFSIAGIATVIGISAKNGVILLDFTKKLLDSGLSPNEAIFKAVEARLRPILMTAFGVILTLIPLLISWSSYSKLQFSLGISIIGGLLVSTLMSLLVLPLLFHRLYHFYLSSHSSLDKMFNSEKDG